MFEYIKSGYLQPAVMEANFSKKLFCFIRQAEFRAVVFYRMGKLVLSAHNSFWGTIHGMPNASLLSLLNKHKSKD